MMFVMEAAVDMLYHVYMFGSKHLLFTPERQESLQEGLGGQRSGSAVRLCSQHFSRANSPCFISIVLLLPDVFFLMMKDSWPIIAFPSA